MSGRVKRWCEHEGFFGLRKAERSLHRMALRPCFGGGHSDGRICLSVNPGRVEQVQAMQERYRPCQPLSHGRFLGKALLICLSALVAVAPARAQDRHNPMHAHIKQGPKMRLEAATWFGTRATEEFVGVMGCPDGHIVAVGNTWGPPFPTNVGEVIELGSDNLVNLPLYPKSWKAPKDEDADAPPRVHPNRTGFFAFFSEDLQRVDRVVRFGWGVASVTAVCVKRDNSLVIAGNAMPGFRVIAEKSPVFKTEPKPEDSGYGPFDFAGVECPGDVYVAKMAPDLKSFEWVWVLEGWRNAPDKLFEGKDGEMFFKLDGIRCIGPDGTVFRSIKGGLGGRKELMGVHPTEGTLLIGGDYNSGTGREPWRRPTLAVLSPEGEHIAQWYWWEGGLVGHDDFRLVSDTSIRAAGFTPAGHVIIYAWSDGGNTVMMNNPVDLEKRAKGSGLGYDLWGATVSSFAHLARFDPKNYDDCYYTALCSYTQRKPNGLAVSKIVAMKDGSVAISGGSAAFFVQHTTEWYRSADQVQYKINADGSAGDKLFWPNGWPMWIGTGGRGQFAMVITPNMDKVLWASSIAECRITDLADTTRGLAIVSRSTGAKDGDSEVMLADNHVAEWPGFVATLKAEGSAAAPSSGKRLMSLFPDALRESIMQSEPKKVDDALKSMLMTEFNNIIANREDFYDEESFKACSFDWMDDWLIRKFRLKTISDEERVELNRRLLERSFPKFIFQAPKANRPPIRKALQPDFGGGYSDGHIYLLVKPRREE